MASFKIFAILTILLLLIVLGACNANNNSKQSSESTYSPAGVELDSKMHEQLLVLANNRAEWFLVNDVTTEALEGLYSSWSVICQNETPLAEYKGAVYEVVRPWFLEMTKMELQDLQGADRHYNLKSWTSPWAYVEEIWELNGKLIWGPQLQLYLIESGSWRYHDC